MSENIVNLYTQQFTTNMELLLQQTTSMLRGKCAEGFYVGKQASPINQVGVIQYKTPVGRFSPIQRQDPTEVRRWVFPKDKDADVLLDQFDLLKTVVDPRGSYMQAFSAGLARAWDDELIAQATATAYTGVDSGGLSSETWSTTYDIADTFGASSTSVGLTVAKMIESRRLFKHVHAESRSGGPMSEPMTLVIGSQQEADLLSQVQVVSTEFNSRPVLDGDGNVTRFLGFDIVMSERLAYASSIRTCIAFVRSGLHLGIWRDMTVDITQAKWLTGHPWQFYSMASFGACRTQLGKVQKVKCADTVTSDITI